MSRLVDALVAFGSWRKAPWIVWVAAVAVRLLLGFAFLEPFGAPLGDENVYAGIAHRLLEAGEFAMVPGEPQINQLFRTVMLHKGSDLHLKAGLPGMMRLRGVIQKMNTPVLTQETLEKLIYPILRD